jgi:hypothetical protein
MESMNTEDDHGKLVTLRSAVATPIAKQDYHHVNYRVRHSRHKHSSWLCHCSKFMIKERFAPGTQASGVTPRFTSSRWIRSEFKTILRNPESRKIFYFLVLNVSYMLIQMLYGVWTNSLGLISDGMCPAFRS